MARSILAARGLPQDLVRRGIPPAATAAVVARLVVDNDCDDDYYAPVPGEGPRKQEPEVVVLWKAMNPPFLGG